MDLGLKGRRALVTGTSRGLGRAIAEALAAEGCNLVLAARNGHELANLASALRERHGVDAAPLECDLSQAADQDRLAGFAADVDILVNNAGANPAGEIDEVDDETWRNAWDLKVFGYIALTRHFYSRMKARRSGVIVNVIGHSGERMNARYILGSTGNSALMSLTRALGSRSPDFDVRVAGINPGLAATDRAEVMLRGWSQQRFGTEDRWKDVLADMNLPFGRMADPREVADTVAFVASQRASYISGTIITVDGGAAHR